MVGIMEAGQWLVMYSVVRRCIRSSRCLSGDGELSLPGEDLIST
jgi:hypothetical protein